MRKAANIERILCDIHDLCVSVAHGNETIVAAEYDEDGDLIVKTMDEKSSYEWTIGFGETEDQDNEG